MTCHTEMEAPPEPVVRRAAPADRRARETLQELSLASLLDPLLTPEQRRTMRRLAPCAEHLILDGTCHVVTVDGRVAASGGWSRREALPRVRRAGPGGAGGVVAVRGVRMSRQID